jgi:serine O-acetyltransferase
VRVGRLDHNNLPDPVIDMFRHMQKQIDELKLEVREIKYKSGGNEDHGA